MDADIFGRMRAAGLNLNSPPYIRTLTPIDALVTSQIIDALCSFPLAQGVVKALEGWMADS